MHVALSRVDNGTTDLGLHDEFLFEQALGDVGEDLGYHESGATLYTKQLSHDPKEIAQRARDEIERRKKES